MAEEIKTMAIPAMIEEAQATGLINDGFEAERLLAQEKIERLKRQHSENRISHVEMEQGIAKIRAEIEEKALALGLDADILA